MRVVFRADASLTIGTGHAMRCLTLGAQLRARGADVTFVCRMLPGHVCELVREQGFTLYALPAPTVPVTDPKADSPMHWLGVTPEEDRTQTANCLSQFGGADWLVVDHYGLDASWEKAMRPHAAKLMVIDDLANRPHQCDVLLDQNLCQDIERRYDTLVPDRCRKLLGPRYALLREEFATARRALRQRSGQIRRILIFFGGVDAAGETVKSIEALALLGTPPLALDVVVGVSNPRSDHIREICKKVPGAHFHASVSNIAELMAAADLAIGAGGTTTWERASLGLPSIIVVVAQNQEALSKAMADQGCALMLTREQATASSILLQVQALMQQPALMRHMQGLNTQLVDGRGAARIARLLIPDAVHLRRAQPADSANIYLWRNSEFVRRNSLNGAPIDRETHDAWYKATLECPKRALLVAEVDGHPVGVLRYDLGRDDAVASIYLVPGSTGKGLGAAILQQGERWMAQHFPKIREILAEILEGNSASSNAFLDAGFRRHRLMFTKPVQS